MLKQGAGRGHLWDVLTAEIPTQLGASSLIYTHKAQVLAGVRRFEAPSSSPSSVSLSEVVSKRRAIRDVPGCGQKEASYKRLLKMKCARCVFGSIPQVTSFEYGALTRIDSKCHAQLEWF